MDLSFLDDEKLKGMDKRKVEILKELSESTKGKGMKEIAPLLSNAMKKMQKEGTAFTKEESSIMMEILTRNMNAQEKAKVEMMKKMMNKQK